MKNPFRRTVTDEPQEAPLTVDSHGIPILDEVVDFDPIALDDSAFTDEATLASSNLALNLPVHDALLKAIREQLKSQLHDELELMIDQVTSEAITRITMDLEKAMREKLHSSLKIRIGELIEQSLDQYLTDTAATPP